jgi:hypothetical protein
MWAGRPPEARLDDFYRTRIREYEGRPFNAEWMQRTFDDFWLAYGQYALGVTASRPYRVRFPLEPDCASETRRSRVMRAACSG